MRMTAALTRAQEKYQKKCYLLHIRFNKETEEDMIEFLFGRGNMSGYIKDLIRKDMANK